MPQPLSSVKFDSELIMGPEQLTTRPTLCALVMQVINYWSFIDIAKAAILSEFMHADEILGLSVYQAVRSPAAQKAILDVAASERLAAADIPVFQAVMAASAGSAKRRHYFAHHLWGITETLPDALLLANPKIFQQYRREIRNNTAQQQKISPPWPYKDLSQILVFTEADLKADVEDAADVEDWMMHLSELARPARADAARQQLLAEPRIQQFLGTR